MANLFPLTPAPHQDNTRPDQIHRPAVVFGHRGPLVNPNRSINHENSIGNAVGGLVNYLNQHGPLKHFGTNARSLGGDVKSSFNPASRAGLVNILTMIAPGAKGGGYGSDPLPEDVLSNWQPAGHFTNYSAHSGNALDRGVMNEGPNIGAKGASMRGLVRRAQGVGGYNHVNPADSIMQKVEALAKERAQISASRQKLQEGSNRMNYSRMVHKELGDKMGGTLVPGGGQWMRDYITHIPNDTQSADFRDRNTLIKLHEQMPGNTMLGAKEPVMQALWDMLFAGKGLVNKPIRPQGGYPFGGGPFG